MDSSCVLSVSSWLTVCTTWSSSVPTSRPAPEEISSGDSVAGQPDPHPGEVDEGAQGPNAVPDDPTGEHPHKP